MNDIASSTTIVTQNGAGVAVRQPSKPAKPRFASLIRVFDPTGVRAGERFGKQAPRVIGIFQQIEYRPLISTRRSGPGRRSARSASMPNCRHGSPAHGACLRAGRSYSTRIDHSIDALYMNHSEENTRADMVRLLIEQAERDTEPTPTE